MKKLLNMLNLNRQEWSWVLYDIGNSAFILLVTAIVPIYFGSLTAAAGLTEEQRFSYWGYGLSVATIVVALIGPICGTLADHKGFKKPLFVACMLLGVVGCAALGGAWSWLSFLVIFVFAKIGFSSSLVFYDAMLPEITTEERMDNVSSMGYALGYIGSVIPFVVCLVVVLNAGSFGLTISSAMVIAFCITAVWWLVCTLPLLKSYRQQAYTEYTGSALTASFRRLGKTFREVRKEKHIFLYLVAFFFFIDGVYTIIGMATAYGSSLGLDSTGLLLALLVTQIVAFPFAILFGRLAQKYSSEKLIAVCIAAYFGIAVFAVFLRSQWQFWLLAVLVGMFQGGIQALSRSYFTRIIPPEQSGEYFGLMDICGKGAAFLGTTLVSAISQFSGSMSTGVGMIAVLFVIGFVLFRMAAKCEAPARD